MSAPGLGERWGPGDVLEVRVVRRFICKFCRRGHSKEAAAYAHALRCFRNPAARSCKTCAAYQPVETGDYQTGYPGCPEGCDAGVTWEGGTMPVGCALWEPRMTPSRSHSASDGGRRAVKTGDSGMSQKEAAAVPQGGEHG